MQDVLYNDIVVSYRVETSYVLLLFRNNLIQFIQIIKNSKISRPTRSKWDPPLCVRRSGTIKEGINLQRNTNKVRTWRWEVSARQWQYNEKDETKQCPCGMKAFSLELPTVSTQTQVKSEVIIRTLPRPLCSYTEKHAVLQPHHRECQHNGAVSVSLWPLYTSDDVMLSAFCLLCLQ